MLACTCLFSILFFRMDADQSAALEEEREELLHDIAQALAESIDTLRTLNRNMEDTVEVGQDFQHVAQVRARSRPGWTSERSCARCEFV